ncbi:MAG TPA: diacylglycerol kinase family protein [Thermoleophilaceae bacterium]|jgi:diacylglycerol kinase family enzyme
MAVVNGTASGAGDPHALLEAVCAELRAAGARAEGVVTGSEAELGEVLASAGRRRVALVGGDGTLHAAVNQPVELPEIAIVPTGRANNVARALGVPLDLRGAASVAANALSRPLDLLRVETGAGHEWCVEGVSAGLQADARSRYGGENSGDVRGGAQAFASALREFEPYDVALCADGSAAFRGQAAQVFLSNLPYFGFGFRVDPLARPRDGLLEAIVLEAESRIDVARLMWSVYRGRHLGRRGVRLARARDAVLTGPVPLAGDGTPLGTGSATVSVEQGRLRVAAP